MAVKTRARPPLAWHEGASRYFIAGLVLLGLFAVGSQIIVGNSAQMPDGVKICEKKCIDLGSNCMNYCNKFVMTDEKSACKEDCRTKKEVCKDDCKAPTPCSDSDGGINVVVPGTCTDALQVFLGAHNDYCFILTDDANPYVYGADPTQLAEFYCSEEGYCSHFGLECPLFPVDMNYNISDPNTFYQPMCAPPLGPGACVIPNYADFFPETP